MGVGTSYETEARALKLGVQKLFALYATGVIPASSWIDSDWEGGQAGAEHNSGSNFSSG